MRFNSAISLAFLAMALGACGTTQYAALPAAPAPVDFASPRVVKDDAPLQCVAFARAQSGVSIFGDASEWWTKAAGRYPRSNEPAEGSVLVLAGYNDNGRGHLAVVRRLVNARTIVVDHANWLNAGEIDLDMPVLDVSPKGDWSQVRVWHPPSGQYGKRIYLAKGFIHPFADIAYSVNRP